MTNTLYKYFIWFLCQNAKGLKCVTSIPLKTENECNLFISVIYQMDN